MLDPMLTLIVAKAKAVGLVAGSALLTTALVGGGAVAMTAVSNESDAEIAVVEPLELETTQEQSDTSTAGIDEEAEEEVEEVEESADDPAKVRPPLPAGFVCDETKNHGQNVSAYGKTLPKGPGRGELVSAVAQSDCGKKDKDPAAESETEDSEVEVEESEVEVEESDESEAKPDKAAKTSAKAEKKAGKAEKKAGKR